MIRRYLKSDRFIALQYRDFRLLWGGQFISLIGSQMQIVALNWHIYLLTHSPVALGIIGLVRFLPIIVFSLLGGSIADVHNRKRVQLISQILLTIFSLILAFLTFNKTVQPLFIYILTAAASATLSFDIPARQAIIPSLVDKKDLANAMSIWVIMRTSAEIIGPALAGFIIAASGVGSIYVLNAFSFLIVVAALLFMKTHGEVIGGENTTVSWGAMKEGIVFVKSRTLIWSTMLLDFFSTFFSSAMALLPVFATQILHVGPRELGFLYAAPAVGAVAAGFIMTHMRTIKKPGIVLLFAVGIYGVATVLFGLSRTYLVSLSALLLIGAGDSVSTIIRNVIRQLATPDHIRGRMTSINMIFFAGGPQLGEFEAGLLAAAVGGPLSVAIGGVSTVIVVGIMAAVIPTLRNYKNPENS